MGADYDDVILVDVDDFVPQLFENQPRPRDGRVLNSSGSAVSQARVTLTDGNSVSRIVLTNGFGYYHFDEVPAGQTYIFNVQHKRYQFSPLALNVMEETNDLNFVALP